VRAASRSSRGALLARILAALVCGAFATAGLGAAAAQATGAAPTASPQPTHIKPRTTLPIIERQVMCVTCKIPLMVAESPQANLEREYIQGLIAKGEDEAQIKRTLVVQYGPAVLGLPADHGFNLAAYLVPLAAVLALLATLIVLLPRWRRHARAQAAASGAAPARLSTAENARLESDIARFD
jgi:cytochrome c-type biogenesis protein CcmH